MSTPDRPDGSASGAVPPDQYAETMSRAVPDHSATQYPVSGSQSTRFASTQFASNEYPSSGYPSASTPVEYPTFTYEPPNNGGGSRAVLLGVAIACVIGLAAAAVFVWLKVADKGDDAPSAAQSGPTVVETQQPTTTVTVPVDPELAAGDSIRTQIEADTESVRTSNNNQWAAQVSSKRLGLVAEGITWDNRAIWSEFEASRSRYPQVKLLDSGDWSVFSEPGWIVTISAQNFSSPQSALTWCRSVGLDKDHCFAKLVSDSRGPEGTTLYQR
ncbi:hypothetical protein [Gordonia phthalatica]|uniref:Uncharacterized protein n=1 Tax=Gordonia phthalatica TaxID=1136941 RepID=A0A0N9N0L6_9ACTN|nr:hypothetical protein [Gordonia phthalatica]ALG83617.1 hypothetical protein ACH46_02700 [Gordonia phthalatica]